jgi:hypothetical protein
MQWFDAACLLLVVGGLRGELLHLQVSSCSAADAAPSCMFSMCHVPDRWHVRRRVDGGCHCCRCWMGAPSCTRSAVSVAMAFSTPASDSLDDPLWQQPLNPASLIVPPVLDTCFVLLSSTGGTTSGSSSSGRSSSSLSNEPSVRVCYVLAAGWPWSTAISAVQHARCHQQPPVTVAASPQS